ncbi:response regulator [uncultured Paenibacillus sp.]|uniref:response regulator n=1 Tax=uncultured Paenibacillus sp. TaxID=227322 RepID=UPI0028D6EBA3|nr:response regulator [uncultured Paenibacillus sp.]
MNTINILLVDDEAIDLEWLRRRVSGFNLPLNVIGTANNGFNALKLMEASRTDIILSDIRMPIMSGIEFARKAKEINPSVKTVFISGHEDFGYAKEAIQLNAYGYLLKPVEDTELYGMLASLCAKVEEEREQNRSLTEALSLVQQELLLRWFNEAAQGPVEQHIRNVLLPLPGTGSAAAIIEPDDLEWKTRDMTEDQRRALIAGLERFIRKYTEDMQLGTFIPDHHARYVVLAGQQEERFSELLDGLIQAVRDAFPLTVTIGVGKFAYELEPLHESYRQAQAALSAKWLLGKNRIIREASDPATQKTLASALEPTVDRMLKAILEYNLVAIDDCLLQLFGKDIPLSRKTDAYDLIIRITSKLHADLQQMNENLYELLKWESHEPVALFQFETVHDILSWLRRRFFELSELLYMKKRKQKRKLIEAIMQYVEDHLEQKVTLKEVAAHFDFTPNYLGHLFKEETGTHFSEFLNERRTKHVCELLSDPTLKIYEIAERCGYKNIIYFNRQFKQSTGMTPGEYRKKHKI